MSIRIASRVSARVAGMLLAAVCLWAGTMTIARSAAQAPAEQAVSPEESVMPRYDEGRALLLPADYQQWRLAGSSLGLSYSEGPAGVGMFHHVLIEPTAYRHFIRTGTFREGTMFALLLHDTGDGVLPGRRGQFASDVRAVEMAVKDSTRVPEGWAYYNFGGRTGIRAAAQPMPKESCYNCHAQHAVRDNVFMQFYPLLAQAAKVSATSLAMPTPTAQVSDTQGATDRLALRGLDPVHLAEGREEMGKPEIVMSHRGFRYQFLSEPTRARFAADPASYAIQNETCPVVPGAPIDPALFAVHAGRVYAFATEDCVAQFKVNPAAFIKPR